MQNRNNIFVICSIISLTLLTACGFSVEHKEDSGVESTDDNLSGTMLAGEDLPEQIGLLKSINDNDEVIITIDNKDITYRLSEDAKEQLDTSQVELGAEVTFTTYTIGDEMETIDRFHME